MKTKIKIQKLDDFRSGEIARVVVPAKTEIVVIEAENGERFAAFKVPRSMNEFIKIPAELAPGIALVFGGIAEEQFLRVGLLDAALSDYGRETAFPCAMQSRERPAPEKPIQRDGLTLIDGVRLPHIIGAFDYDSNHKFRVRRDEFSSRKIFERFVRIGAFEYFEEIERAGFIAELEALPTRRAKFWLEELIESGKI